VSETFPELLRRISSEPAADMARRAGVSASQWSRWLSGRSAPPPKRAAVLAKRLGIEKDVVARALAEAGEEELDDDDVSDNEAVALFSEGVAAVTSRLDAHEARLHKIEQHLGWSR
jgi:transcriptional regulator with XRE-family HTH domain